MSSGASPGPRSLGCARERRFLLIGMALTWISVCFPGGVHYSARDKAVIAMKLEDLFCVARVDLVMLPGADPFLAAEIVRGERVYCGDAYIVDEYELYVLRRAGDLAPLERDRTSLILGVQD